MGKEGVWWVRRVFGVRRPALEPAGSCVGLGLGVDMDISGSMNTD